MNISPLNPIGPAWNRMLKILFKPFDLKKWLILGFCVFLAQCGTGGNAGGGGGGNFPPPTTGRALKAAAKLLLPP